MKIYIVTESHWSLIEGQLLASYASPKKRNGELINLTGTIRAEISVDISADPRKVEEVTDPFTLFETINGLIAAHKD